MCNKTNVIKKFFVIIKNSSTKLEPTVLDVLKYHQNIDNIYKMNIMYEQKFLNQSDINQLSLKTSHYIATDDNIQIIPINIPASYFLQ
jgi:hypothetical protein